MRRFLLNNAVYRLLASYLVILVVVGATCLAGIGRTLDIVDRNTIQESENLLKQGVSDVDYLLRSLRTCGMSLSASSNLKELGKLESTKSMEYYYLVKKELAEYMEEVKYLDNVVFLENFIYINGVERILYDGGVYTQNVFQSYRGKWGFEQGEWDDICSSQNSAPHFYVTKGGELFWMFPCTNGLGNQERLATVFFHIGESSVLDRMQFLQDYSGYSLFWLQDGKTLMACGGLGAKELLEEEMPEDNTAVRVGTRLILSRKSEVQNCSYILVLPEDEAFVKIERLKLFIFIPLGLALMAGIGFAVYCAVKTGKPINNIARKLSGMGDTDGESAFNTNLSYLDATIEQIIEVQKADKGALQQSFFHNLLKADFVSRTELEYMAQRADIPITGREYFAAAVRLFPQMEDDRVDGRTVEEARALQLILGERLRQKYPGAVWSYKRKALEIQYIMEARALDIDDLKQEMCRTVGWLKECHHVDSRWGISSACTDLMNFWRNGEEAFTALGYANPREVVRTYSEIGNLDNSFYLPYSMEERLAQGLKSGNFELTGQTVDMLCEENTVRRKLGREQFLKLNRRLSDIMAAQCDKTAGMEECLLGLNSHVIDDKRDDEAYFAELKEVCYRICSVAAGQKSLKRSNKIKAIIRYIEENYSNTNMGLAMVSEAFGISEGYLSALFKEEVGTNFGDYLENIRIREACRRLRCGELVANIAQQTGYNSVQSFRRAFKRVVGVSPSEYRGE